MTASVAAVVPQTRIRPFRDTLCRVVLACCFSVSVPALAEESRVRVRAPSVVGSEKWVVGTLRRLDERSVLLEVEGRTSAIEIPVEAVTRFEVSRGWPSPLRTAAYGAAGGGLGTAIATGVVAAGSGAGLSAEGVAFGFALSTAFGAAVGTVAGLGTRVLPLDRRSVRNGAWIGAAFGAAALGGVVALGSLGDVEGLGPAYGGVMGAVVGAPIGAVAGAVAVAFAGEEWEPTPLGDLRVGVAPTPGGGVAASVSFGF